MRLSPQTSAEDIIERLGSRVTKGRVELLSVLLASHTPLTAQELLAKLSHSLNKTTLYRALDDFVEKGEVKKVYLQGDAVRYEVLRHDYHHHHIVCSVCGVIEDVGQCNQVSIQKEVLHHSALFGTISSHTLEFVGVCRKCQKKQK